MAAFLCGRSHFNHYCDVKIQSYLTGGGFEQIYEVLDPKFPKECVFLDALYILCI